VRTFFKFFIGLTFFIVLIVAGAIYLAIDDHAQTSQQHMLAPDSALHSKKALAHLYQQLSSNQPEKQITLSQQEMHAFSALANRAFPALTSEVLLSERGAYIALSYLLPLHEKYINATLRVLPSDNGLEISHVSIGDVRVSGKFAISIAQWFVNELVQPELGDKLVSVINDVSFTESTVILNAILDDNLLKKDNQSGLLVIIREYLGFSAQSNLANSYYQFLATEAMRYPKGSDLASIINVLFSEVKRKAQHLMPEQIRAHNKAATVALVNYFGDNRFQLLFGKLSPISRVNTVKRRVLKSSVSLQQRVDLQKHFIYSMALQLLSNEQASDAIGEFKEFLDANIGGSGFSFADLLADRAGTRLAMLITNPNVASLKVTEQLAVVTEQQLLPSIKGLAEGLHAEEFTQEYKHIRSKDYQNAVSKIDERLKGLALYQPSFGE